MRNPDKTPDKTETLPLGVVLRKQPGVTRWQPWVWRATAVLPGAAASTWRELRREGDVVEYHAATLSLELHRADTEAYLHELNCKTPCVYVVLRQARPSGDEGAGDDDKPFDVERVTASPYEAQDYADSGDDIVEKVPMPSALLAFVRAFVEAHHQEETFVKRKRSEMRVDLVEDGVGDPRVVKRADIYASPAVKRRRLQ